MPVPATSLDPEQLDSLSLQCTEYSIVFLFGRSLDRSVIGRRWKEDSPSANHSLPEVRFEILGSSRFFALRCEILYHWLVHTRPLATILFHQISSNPNIVILSPNALIWLRTFDDTPWGCPQETVSGSFNRFVSRVSSVSLLSLLMSREHHLIYTSARPAFAKIILRCRCTGREFCQLKHAWASSRSTCYTV